MTSTEEKVVPALILGWLIPGAGHYYLGYKWKGISLFFLLFLAYFAGMAMADFRNVNFRDPAYVSAYCFAGGMTIASLCATAHLSAAADTLLQSYRLGCLYTTIASLLNALAMLQVYSISRGKEEKAKKEKTAE